MTSFYMNNLLLWTSNRYGIWESDVVNISCKYKKKSSFGCFRLRKLVNTGFTCQTAEKRRSLVALGRGLLNTVTVYSKIRWEEWKRPDKTGRRWIQGVVKTGLTVVSYKTFLVFFYRNVDWVIYNLFNIFVIIRDPSTF